MSWITIEPAVSPWLLAVRRAWHETRQFDWRRSWILSHAGRWPIVPRILVLLVYTVSTVTLALMVSAWIMPTITDQQRAELIRVRHTVTAQRDHNAHVVAQHYSQQWHRSILHPLLQQVVTERADITQALTMVNSAAASSDVDLLSLSPRIEAGSEQIQMTLSARLRLPTLLAFWSRLADAPAHFDLHGLELTRSKAVGEFDLNMTLLAQSVADIADIGQPPMQNFAEVQPGYTAYGETTVHKGFVWRQGDAGISFLLSDEAGQLIRVDSRTKTSAADDAATRR